MIVIDASVLTNAFTDDGPVGTRSRAELARDTHWAAPEHLVVEVFFAVRERWLGQKISEKRAADALAAMVTTTIDRVAAAHLLTRACGRGATTFRPTPPTLPLPRPSAARW